jgi:hypothetical protein
MANIIEIRVTGQNSSTPATEQAVQQVKKLTDVTKTAAATAAGFLTANLIQGAAVRVKDFVTGTLHAASDLEQAVGGTTAVFHDLSGEISAFAETSKTSVGLSQNDFRVLSAQVGGQLKRMSGDLQFASDKTIELTKVAADLSATYGGTTKEAMEAFSAALRGEADPAERFNLNLKITAVQAKAVELGLAKSTLSVSQAAMAQATYALIMDQSKDALGQFNRENDTAAHRMQVANATLEDAKAKLGEGLLPIYSRAAELAATLTDAFASLPGPAQIAVASILGVGAGALVILPKLAAAKAAISELNITMAATRAFVAGPWGLAIGAAVALIGVFAASQHAAAQRVEELAGQLDLSTDRLNDNNRAVIANKLEQEGLLKTARELGFNTQDLTDAILSGTDALNGMGIRQGNYNKQMTEQQAKTVVFSNAVLQLAGDVQTATAATDRKNEATGKSTAATKDNTDATQDNIDAIVRQARHLQDEFDPMAKLIHAQQDVAKARRDYTKAVKEHGKASPEARQAELDLAAAILDSGTAAATTSGQFNGKLDPAMRQVLRLGGLTEGQINDIEKQFIAAKKAGDKYATTYNAQANLTFKVHGLGSFRFDSAGDPVHHAAGGPMGAGVQTYNPGEEIARLPDGTSILPAGMSRQLMSGVSGGASTPTRVSLSVEVGRASGLAFLDGLVEGLRFKIRTEGNNNPDQYLRG